MTAATSWFRALATLCVTLLAGCASVVLRPTDVSYDAASGPPVWRAGDVEVTIRMRAGGGEFPVTASLANRGPAAVRVSVRLAAGDGGERIVGERSSGPGAPAPIVAGEPFELAPCGDSDPVEIRLRSDRRWTLDHPATKGDTATYAFETTSPSGIAGGAVSLVVVSSSADGSYAQTGMGPVDAGLGIAGVLQVFSVFH